MTKSGGFGSAKAASAATAVGPFLSTLCMATTSCRGARGWVLFMPMAKRKISFYECVDGFGNRVPEIDFPGVLDIIEGLDKNTG